MKKTSEKTRPASSHRVTQEEYRHYESLQGSVISFTLLRTSGHDTSIAASSPLPAEAIERRKDPSDHEK